MFLWNVDRSGIMQDLLGHLKSNSCVNFILLRVRYSPADMAFLSEYATTMSPVAKAINILQGEKDVQMGWLLPTITTIITKLEKMKPSLRFCKPLVDALLSGLSKRFGGMMCDPELIAAAILNPKFKTSWTTDENILKLGKEDVLNVLILPTLKH